MTAESRTAARPRLLLVHGSVVNAELTWSAQKPLADRFDVVAAELLQGARTLMVERPPSEAGIPLERLAAAPFPLLAVSGGHEPAFETVCDVLAERAGAERAVLPGAGHSVQRLGTPFNELLAAFVERAEV